MLQVTVNDKNTFAIKEEDGRMVINDAAIDWDASQQPNGLISVLFNGKSYTAIVEHTDRKAKEVMLRINGQVYKMAIKEPIDQLLTNMGLDLTSMQKLEPLCPAWYSRCLLSPASRSIKVMASSYLRL